MAKINFKQFKVAQDIAHTKFSEHDLREGIANHLYKERGGIASLDLAMKIYRSEGETEYSDKEVGMLRDILANSTFNCAVFDAFNEVINNQKSE